MNTEHLLEEIIAILTLSLTESYKHIWINQNGLFSSLQHTMYVCLHVHKYNYPIFQSKSNKL